MPNLAIKVEHVSKTFKLPHEKQSSVKGLFLNIFKLNRTFEKQRVLHNISFEVKEGEFFGVVGRNGSGKSTLLKLLAGIYTPDKGNIEINGTLTPFIELGVGFNPELTGRQNVYLNGALLGFDHAEMDEMYQEIVDFAEIEQFMDQKLKNYSSGMQVRLAFSVAIRARGDILLIDEVLAVGDAAFQAKCFEYFRLLKEQKKTVVFISHDIGAMQRMCDRAMLIHKGDILMMGDPNDVGSEYLRLNSPGETTQVIKPGEKPDYPYVNKVAIQGADKQAQKIFKKLEPITVKIDYTNDKKTDIQFGVQIYDIHGQYCFGTNSALSKQEAIKSAKGTVYLEIEQTLGNGEYYVNVATMDKYAHQIYDYKKQIERFRINTQEDHEGLTYAKHTWHKQGK